MGSNEISHSDAPSAPIEVMLDTTFGAFNRGDAPGLMVGVAYKGQIVYRRGFGLASVELGVANSPTTRSRIGSTSKHFCCLAALLLAEGGKLDIDSNVRSHFPELPALAGEPTLRQLMTHTSGYRCYLSTGFIADGTAMRPPGAVMRMQSRQRDVNFAPGERFMYNNSGYHLLSLIVQRVSGMPFAQYLKDRIFDPVGMVDTALVSSDFEVLPRVAGLYLSEPGGGYRKGIFPTEEMLGEGGIISTVDDILLWLAHMRGRKRVGSEQSWGEMTTPARLKNGRVLNYALGLLKHDYRGVEVIHHPGGVFGGCSQMLTVPSHALDVIIVANKGGVDAIRLAYDVVDAVLGDELAAAVERRSSESCEPLLGRRYFSAARTGYQFGFDDVAGKLALSIMNGPPVPLNIDGERLRLNLLEDRSGGPYELVLPASLEQAPATLTMSEGGNSEVFHLLPQVPPPTLDAGAALIGHYRGNDLNAEAEIAIEGDALLLKIYGEYGTNVMDLQAFSAELFGWKPRGGVPEIGTLHVQRVGDRISSLLIDSFRTRHLLLERLAD